MTTTIPAISPLRQRMIDDMRMRQLADKTQSHYLRAVASFRFFWDALLIPRPLRTCGAINSTWLTKAFPPSHSMLPSPASNSSLT